MDTNATRNNNPKEVTMDHATAARILGYNNIDNVAMFGHLHLSGMVELARGRRFSANAPLRFKVAADVYAAECERRLDEMIASE